MSCGAIHECYNLAFTAYEAFNEHTLIIKGWAVAISLATMLSAFHAEREAYRRVILILSIVTASMFWVTDAVWKSYQNAYLELLESYEKLSASSTPNAFKGTVLGWKDHFSEFDFIANMFLSSSTLPYIPIIIFGVIVLWREPKPTSS